MTAARAPPGRRWMLHWSRAAAAVALAVVCSLLSPHPHLVHGAGDAPFATSPTSSSSLLYVEWFVHDDAGRAVPSVPISVEVKGRPIRLDAASTAIATAASSLFSTPPLRWLLCTDEDGRATLHTDVAQPEHTPLHLSSTLLAFTSSPYTSASAATQLPGFQPAAAKRDSIARTGPPPPHCSATLRFHAFRSASPVAALRPHAAVIC